MTSRASESLYKSFFENMFDGLAYCQMLFDKKDNPVGFMYVEVNKNFEKLTGLKGAIGKKVTELLPGIQTSNPEAFEICGRVSLSGKPEKFETYIEPLKRWFLVSVYSPKKKFFVAVFQNTTDRKQTEKDLENAKIAALNVYEDLQVEKGRLTEAKAKDEALLESIGEGVIAVDQEGKVILINKVAENHLGFTGREVIGKPLVQVIFLEDVQGKQIPDAQRPITIALTFKKTTTTTTTTYYLVRKDGTKFSAAITATPFLLATEPIGAIMVFRDITKEKEIDRAKTEFVSLASHQLRTPITSIRWYAEMLLKNDVGELAPDQQKYVTEIYKNDRRMIDLVNSLLNISRIELGTLALRPEIVDVSKLLLEIERDLAQQIAEKHITVKYAYPHDGLRIKTDPQLLKVVLQNLFTNAVEYTAPATPISIYVEQSAREMRVAVTDKGCGIPEDVREKIFTKFYRADNARAMKPDGSGLGLYMTKSIVLALGGTIRFESHAGQETTFFVTVPELLAKQDGTPFIS